MSVIRNELRTGFLVAFAAVMLAGVLVYLEAPGLSGERRIFRIYFDNAGGINGGAPVMLAGRRIGQVSRIISPVPEAQRPQPQLAVIVEVAVDPKARIYQQQRVLMVQYSLLGEDVIDFTQGKENSGLATSDTRFIGIRQPGLADVGQQVLEKLEPVVGSASLAMKDLQKTCSHLTEITAQGSDMVVAIANFRQLGERLVVMSGTNGALQGALDNVEDLTSKEGPLAKALANAQKFTGELAGNKDVGVALRNFRRASENFNSSAVALKGGVRGIRPSLDQTVRNAEQFTDTVKRQPWRLIWPTTKQYPEDQPEGLCPVAAKSR
jgi:ABC-type transporter Mla subunit MlaD